jgi:hypothetical protein
MKRENRCLHPDVTFTLNEEGFEGHRPRTVQLLKLIKAEEV